MRVWIGELIGGRLGACGNWLSDGRGLSQEFWLPHLVSGQDCPGCSSGISCLKTVKFWEREIKASTFPTWESVLV